MTKRLFDKRWKKFAVLALSGVLTGMTLVFQQIGLIEWLTLIPLGLFLLSEADKQEYRARGIYAYGFFYFLCFYVTSFHWFVNLYPLEFIDGMTAWAAVAVVMAGVFGLSALQAFFGGFAFVTVRLLFKTKLLSEKRILRPFAVAGVYTVYEWTQTLGWWGVPWARLPIGQARYEVGLQTASILGSYFVTFMLLCFNMCIAYVLLEKSKIKLMSTIAASVLLVQYGLGTALWLVPVDGEQTVKVAAVQGNISSNEKWDSESKERTLEVYEKYTLQAAENGAQIVVWPETALPYPVEENGRYGKYCSRIARKADVTLLFGGFTEHENGGELNSIICVLPDGSFHENVYSKQRLVPFGEFVPMKGLFKALIPPLAELVMSGDDVVAGEGAQVMDLPEASVGSLICFDSLYEDLARDSTLDGAQIICLSTNDSWFTDSAALYIHNAQAQLRAIENGRYIVRAANTGISTVISSKGEVLEQLDPLVEGIVEYDVSVNTHKTPYTVIGNLFVFVLGVAIICIFGYDISVKLINRRQKSIDKRICL
ncbi:MAG: apolipoprotein N-acyltransferase [Clostridia bacterium]|nr:apolipoprotein N-acyltransferase [Clostridia bacterium]